MSIRGSIVALVTPWKDDALHCEALENLVEWHRHSGTQALLVAASTGEGLLLTPQERRDVIRIALMQRDMPVIVGCCAPSTHETLRLGEEALAMGAHALLVVTPFYVKPTQLGIVKHFHTLCDAWQSPVMAYNNPSRCSVDMSVECVCDIARNPYVMGLKDSSIHVERIAQIRAKLPRPLSLFAGEDAYAQPYLRHGGDGWVSVVGNVAPGLCRQVCDTGGLVVQQTLSELIHALNIGSNPVAVKAALSYMGKIRQDVRLPLLALEQVDERLQQAVALCA